MFLFITVELKQHYDEQVKEMVGKYQRELTQIQDDHKVELNRMQKALDVVSDSRPEDFCNGPENHLGVEKQEGREGLEGSSKLNYQGVR